MIFTPIDTVTVPANRYRREFDEGKLTELAEGIQSKGLLHPPVVRKVGDHFELVAGERRLRAMMKLINEGRGFCYLHTPVPPGNIPVAFHEDLDTLTAKELELEENVLRTDLTWQERCLAIEDLHNLRVAQHPEWNMTDTAEELTGKRTATTAAVHEQIILAQNLQRDSVRKAASPKEALKALKKELQNEFATAYGTRVGQLQSEKLHLVQCEALEGLGFVPAGSFDVILTDPPYGIDAEKFDADMLTTHNYDDRWETVRALLERFASESFRVARSQAHLYCFCDILRFFDLKALFGAAGWDVWPRPLIWHKDVGHIPKPNYGPQRVYETILFANKGDKPVTALYQDVIDCPAVKHKHHAAEKPVELYMNLLRRSAMPDSRICDPFCGSGTIFEAAYNLKIEAFGMDNDPQSIGLAAERIRRLGK